MHQDDSSAAIDRTFAVPFTHRLRFTHDVFGGDGEVLASLLDPDGFGEPSSADGQPQARVQFWIDQQVALANPELKQRIHSFCDRYRQRLCRAGNIQLVVGGEELKNDIHVLERMLKIFNVTDLDRRSYVVVIGGGAVLDTVGFAASIAHRGIRLVRIPTTTLAQGDSGVGVKNGVNLFQKKNWLGSFAVPWGVINDARLLQTLSDRDFVSGFAEAVKVALLKDPELFERICGDAARIRQRQMEAALPVIRRSALLHLDHITAGGDPFEMLEARPLDFGHWSAHKLESMSGFAMRHGEAVAIGVAIDTMYSSLCFGFPRQHAEALLACFQTLGLPLNSPLLRDTAVLFQGLEEFRQHLGGRLTLTMLREIGQPLEAHEIDQRRMRQAIDLVNDFAQQRRSHEVV